MNAMIVAAAFAATNATAQLAPVVVEATRLGKSPEEIPASVQVIGRGEIAASGARDVADLLQKKCASLDFAHLGANNPALAQIAPRGYGDNGFGRLLVVVDGERLVCPDMNAPNLSQIPLGSIERIEVLHGSQNVLHGDAASAGMINIVTDPADWGTHGHAEVHGGSRGTIGASASLRGGCEESGTRWWANGGWDHSDGYRHDGEFDVYSAGGGFRQDFDKGSYVRVSAFYSDADYGLAGSLSKAQWRSSAKASDGLEDFYRRTTYGLNATVYGVVDDENAVRLTQAVSHRHMQSRGYGYWYTDYDIYSYEFTPEWINTTKIGAFENEFIAGATFRYDRNDAANWGGGYGRSKYEYDRQTMGFYAQDTFSLTDYVALEVGGRYERSWNKCTMVDSPNRVYDIAAYDAALLFTPVDGFKSYFKYSNFYRMPFIDEFVFHSRDDLLSPEHGWRVDAGFDWSVADEFSLAGNVYVSRTKQEIFYDALYPYMSFYGPSYGDNANSPSPVVREGFDLRASWERDKVAGVSVAYSFVDAEFDGGRYDGNDVPMSATSVASVSGKVWLWDDCFVFGGYRYRTSCCMINDLENRHEKLAAFGIFNLGVQYSPAQFGLEGLKFAFVVDNLFDKDYCDYAACNATTGAAGYYPAAGRSYMFSVRYDF